MLKTFICILKISNRYVAKRGIRDGGACPQIFSEFAKSPRLEKKF